MLHLIIVHFFGLITPGPDFLYISRLAASHTARHALYGVLGITLGVSFWALASILGLALLFATMPMLHGVILCLGGSYLMYLGGVMLKSRPNVVFEQASEPILQTNSLKKEMFRGLMVNLSNAKAIIYFASVMSLVLVNLTETWQILTALFVIVLETFLYFYLVSLLFSRPIAKRIYRENSRYIDLLSGTIFLLFGGYLVYSGYLEMTHII